jgi:hypothetical protein
LDKEIEENEVLVKLQNLKINKLENFVVDIDAKEFPFLKNVLIQVEGNMKEALTIFKG